MNTIPEAERNAAQKAQLASKKELLQRLEAPPAVLSIFGDLTADRFAKEMTKIAMPSIAISDDYLFLTCSESMHYDVWRFDHNFENPKKVVRRAVGCCRQLDIQSDGKDLLVAENAKFRVVRFDNRGKKLSQFGSRGGKEAGFGSCCNPMNIRCCENGDILTAESSVGDIKRFSPDGKLQALIGTAEVGAGCKRVTLEHDTELDRYYIMHEDHGYICVLVPMSEAPEFTEQELATKEAREGLGKKLVGKWTLVAGSSKPSMAMSLIGFDTPPPKSLHFHDDGRLAFEGYLFSGPKNNNPEKSKHQQPKSRNRWVAKSQNGKKLVVFQMVDRVEALKFDMTFLADDKLRVVGLEGPLTVFTATFTTSEQSQK